MRQRSLRFDAAPNAACTLPNGPRHPALLRRRPLVTSRPFQHARSSQPSGRESSPRLPPASPRRLPTTSAAPQPLLDCPARRHRRPRKLRQPPCHAGAKVQADRELQPTFHRRPPPRRPPHNLRRVEPAHPLLVYPREEALEEEHDQKLISFTAYLKTHPNNLDAQRRHRRRQARPPPIPSRRVPAPLSSQPPSEEFGQPTKKSSS